MMERVTAEKVGQFIAENADLSCRMITDELSIYTKLGKHFEGGHEVVT